MADRKSPLDRLNNILLEFEGLDGDEQQRLLATVNTYLCNHKSTPSNQPNGQNLAHQLVAPSPQFSQRTDQSPKQFLAERQPQTDIDRVACLAFYLTNYRQQPHFKTLDISKLNTEAAQPKFANAAYAVNNASHRGFLASAPRGAKQITALGEHYVIALPDYDRARATLESMSRRTRRNRPRPTK